MTRLLLLLIDGIGADCFQRCLPRCPHLSRLTSEGHLVRRLAPETCATSLPGRASILTGVPAREHSIYGNLIWDSTGTSPCFRYARPDDIQVPTLAALAKSQHKVVAGIGFGMLAEADCHIYLPPFWSGEYKYTTNPAHSPPISMPAYSDREHYRFNGLINDTLLLEQAFRTGIGDNSADLIFAELAMPDYLLHDYGEDSPQMQWNLLWIDAQISLLLGWMAMAKQHWNLVLVSDHGHAATTKAIYPEKILPDNTPYACEGATLHIAVRSDAEREHIKSLMAPFGISDSGNRHLPKNTASEVLALLAPDHCVFETANKASGSARTGISHYRSSHGFRFGHPADERFALFHGPDIPTGVTGFATAGQLTPTVAELAGLGTMTYPEPPIFFPKHLWHIN